MIGAIVSYFAKLAERHDWLRTKEFILYVGMGVPILPGVIAALIAPDDVLTRYRALQVVADAMSTLIPAIDKYPSASQFPEVTRLTLTLYWVMGILQAIFLYLLLAVARYRRVESRLSPAPPEAPAKVSLKVVLVSIPSLWFCWWLAVAGPSTQSLVTASYFQARSQYRIGLAMFTAVLFSQVILMLFASCAASALWLLRRYEHG